MRPDKEWIAPGFVILTVMKKEIESRQEVELLIRSFYARVREEEVLGPIFNGRIHDWEAHFERLIDFWETNLFFVRKYKGDPLKVHLEVDEATGQAITPEHFGRWLNLWVNTIDEHFTGETAQIAKNRARNMGSFLFLKIFEHRQPSTDN